MPIYGYSVPIYQDQAVDIHFLDSSLFSLCLQLELMLNDVGSQDGDDDKEFFRNCLDIWGEIMIAKNFEKLVVLARSSSKVLLCFNLLWIEKNSFFQKDFA